MRLQKLQAVEKEISRFQPADDDAIYSRVAELDRQIKRSAVNALFSASPLMDLSEEARSAMLESVAFQELASAFIWDALSVGVGYERGLQIMEAQEGLAS